MPYLYEGLEASLYDTLDELSGFEDLEFYQWFANANGGNVLDIGCGTGRVLIPLVEAGLEVTGLEFAPKMIELCRANLNAKNLKADLLEGDMRGFDFGDLRFSTVMIPGYSFQLLLEDEALVNCLRCCREHLADGGQLVLPTFMPWDMIWEGCDSKPLEERRSVVDKATGEKLSAYQGWRLESEKQWLHLVNRYERLDALGKLLAEEEKKMTIRWHQPHDMLQLLGEAGFGDVSMYGDFGFEPPDEESESVIYVARV